MYIIYIYIYIEREREREKKRDILCLRNAPRYFQHRLPVSLYPGANPAAILVSHVP